jgi:hypothetical protein
MEMPALFKLLNSIPVYTNDPNTVSRGDGLYSDDDWYCTRLKNNIFYSNPSKNHYFEMIFDSPEKIKSANDLCSSFDFSAYNRIGDIGGIPFSQSWVINKIHPKIEFYLTDNDKLSLDKHRISPPFSHSKCSFFEFDVTKDDLNIFKDCILLTMWGVDYHLSDSQFIDLIQKVKSLKKSLLIASVNIDDISQMRRFVSIVSKKISAFRGFSRQIGILRNSNYIYNLSNLAGSKCSCVCKNDFYKVFHIL